MKEQLEDINICELCTHFDKECEYPFSRKDMRKNKDGIIILCLYYEKK